MLFFLFTLFLTFLAIVGAALYLGKRYLKIHSLGECPITTQEMAFDTQKNGHKITWNKHCFFINSEPIILVSGEFHYWRLPDQNRWKSILMQYKAGGLNCIRIYFHWGYHSPDEGVYLWEGNKDVEYLLTLCEELELFVLCAPGPYICAETQAGGLPLWMIQKREIRIRHSVITGFRKFDQKFMDCQKQWFDAIMPILARHQITKKPNGCVLAVQIENEVMEEFVGVPIGLADDMKLLCKSARDNGIDVPLFTNDAFENGSFIARKEDDKTHGKSHFGIDLYGFDKYVIFCPTSDPSTLIAAGNDSGSAWPEWKPENFAKSFATTESCVRAFGGAAAETPIFIPELQGGWFNHYTLETTYDAVYDYYGGSFTKMVMETALSQGSTAFSIYMYYGGTNWGTLGDPDVYTSYDYSACIREFGFFSERGRLARLALLFARSFQKELVQTEAENLSLRDSFIISADIPDYLPRQRRSIGLNSVYFLFFRNFSKNKTSGAVVSYRLKSGAEILLKSKVPYKQSFVGIANYHIKSIHLLISTIPIHVKMLIEGIETWVIQCDDNFDGNFVFAQEVVVTGDLSAVIEKQHGYTLVSFQENKGTATITHGNTIIHVIALTGNDLLSLSAVFTEHYWKGKTEIKGLFWGPYGIKYDVSTQELIIQQSVEDETVYAISDNPLPQEFLPNNIISSMKLENFQEPIDIIPEIEFNEIKVIDFSKLDFKPLGKIGKKRKNIIDHCYTSGHSIYKLEFNASTVPLKDLKLALNMRHRCAVYVNGESVGSHMTYSLSMIRPGAKNGPDFGFGKHTYSIPVSLVKQGANEIICVVENLGLNRCPGPLNDTRVPRGIIDAKIVGYELEWFISGVDVRKLDNVFNHTGIAENQPFTKMDTIKGDNLPLGILVPTIFKGAFTYESKAVAPIRLNVGGDNSAMITINNILIARYYGNKGGPQTDFYIPDGILHKENTIEVLTYSGDTKKKSGLGLKFDLWKVDELMKSGNVTKNGKNFVVKESRVRLL